MCHWERNRAILLLLNCLWYIRILFANKYRGMGRSAPSAFIVAHFPLLTSSTVKLAVSLLSLRHWQALKTPRNCSSDYRCESIRARVSFNLRAKFSLSMVIARFARRMGKIRNKYIPSRWHLKPTLLSRVNSKIRAAFSRWYVNWIQVFVCRKSFATFLWHTHSLAGKGTFFRAEHRLADVTSVKIPNKSPID